MGLNQSQTASSAATSSPPGSSDPHPDSPLDRPSDLPPPSQDRLTEQEWLSFCPTSLRRLVGTDRIGVDDHKFWHHDIMVSQPCSARIVLQSLWFYAELGLIAFGRSAGSFGSSGSGWSHHVLLLAARYFYFLLISPACRLLVSLMFFFSDLSLMMFRAQPFAVRQSPKFAQCVDV